MRTNINPRLIYICIRGYTKYKILEFNFYIYVYYSKVKVKKKKKTKEKKLFA